MQRETIRRMWIELFISPSINTISLMQTDSAETGAMQGRKNKNGEKVIRRWSDGEITVLGKINIWKTREEEKKGGENKMCRFKR